MGEGRRLGSRLFHRAQAGMPAFHGLTLEGRARSALATFFDLVGYMVC